MIAFAFLVAMAFSAVPAPLYPLYQARDGFSTFMVTVIFAVYAVGVVISLVLAGHISDWVGRKKILIPALVLELAAAALFLAVPELWALLVARFISGLGVGMLTATATAHLHDLHVRHRPGASKQRFEIVSTAANIGGIGLGPLVSGLLAQFVIEPLRTPYLVFGILIAMSIVAVLLTPETVEEQPVKPTYRPQRISADHGDRAGYIAAPAIGLRRLRRVRRLYLRRPVLCGNHARTALPSDLRARRVRRVRSGRHRPDRHQPPGAQNPPDRRAPRDDCRTCCTRDRHDQH
jgi:MFS family permease